MTATTVRCRRLALRWLGGSAAVAGIGALVACQPMASGGGPSADAERITATSSSRPAAPLQLTVNVPDGAGAVPVDTAVSVAASGGTISQVEVWAGPSDGAAPLTGTLDDDATSWLADDLLEPGQAYQVVVQGEDSQGRIRTKRSSFRTEPLTLDQQTYPGITPKAGKTVGVGMPVVVTFDVAVTDRAAVEQHLSVRSDPQVEGSWHWVSDHEVHYRPRHFWPAGAHVTVDADINGVDAGGGIYGQEDREVTFTVGDRVVDRVNVQTDRLRVFVNGKLVRRIPVTTGAAGTRTRGGTSVIIEKRASTRMDAATTGVSPSDPNYYNIANVQYAMRITLSGEFLHAAPWSVAFQGHENVSHGCVGMSTKEARWLFHHSSVGDVVTVVGSDRRLEDGNGWTDWNESYAEYRQGSALS